MQGIKLLDCTLREAPIDGLMWGNLSVNKTINGLENAKVDIIEVGFLKDNIYKNGSTSFHRVEDIEQYLQQKVHDVMYVALVDYGRYNLDNLSEYNGKSIDTIRVCFKHNEISRVLDYAEQIRKKGYKVCIQHVDTMGFSDDEIVDFIKKVNIFKPFAYSIVDTFGAMYCSDMIHFARLVDSYLDKDIWLGFHAHNNLMLADANAQHFAEYFTGKRNIIIDSSLYGCGRSAGNTHTELIAQYMNSKQDAKYDINELLDLIDTVIVAAQKNTSWGYSIPYFIAGMHNAHTFNVKQLLKRHNLKSKDLRGIIEMLDEDKKKEYDYALLEKLYVQYFNVFVDDSEVIKELERKLCNKSILLLAPGKTVYEKKGDIEKFVNEKHPTVIGVNNLIEGYKMDYIFYSSRIRYQNLQYQEYKNAGLPTILLTSNIKDCADNNERTLNYISLIKFGWVNLDSSAILLLRLLIRCGIYEIYVAGLDGYKSFGNAFYSNELDTGLDEESRIGQTEDNISMMTDLIQENPKLKVHFLTESIYKEVFE